MCIRDRGEYLQSFLEDDDSVLFSQIYTTERPDVFVSKLYEGSVGIIVDGTPFALVLPCLFAENFVTTVSYTHLVPTRIANPRSAIRQIALSVAYYHSQG